MQSFAKWQGERVYTARGYRSSCFFVYKDTTKVTIHGLGMR